jgi:DNA replication and repair protein RecF
VEHGHDAAQVEALFERAGRTALLGVEITPGRTNRLSVNGAPLSKPRDVLGIVHTVIFAPEDLDLVKGDPSVRRKYLDDFAVALAPRIAGVRADFERVLRQRNALLKSAGRRSLSSEAQQSLEAWNEQFVNHASALVRARLSALDRLAPWIAEHGDTMSGSNEPLTAEYAAGWLESATRDEHDIAHQLRVAIQQRQSEELDRGLSLVGPHRDDVQLALSGAPAKGYASHGQSWSIALAMRLATFSVLRELDDDPILLLDDVFAELDERRRSRLLTAVRGVEQTIVTAAVAADVPADMLHHVHKLAD